MLKLDLTRVGLFYLDIWIENGLLYVETWDFFYRPYLRSKEGKSVTEHRYS
jgi:hypothetical protein